MSEAFLTAQLDDPATRPCGRCANCTGPFAVTEADPERAAQARIFLRRAYRVIEPRKQWPPGLDDPRGKIPEEHQLLEGRALCIYNDAGWGQIVRKGKFDSDGFSDDLVDAAAEMLERWDPEPAPQWVAVVPSLRHPKLVPDLAQRLAEWCGLPFSAALVKVRDTPEQKGMQNSVQQARNVLEAFEAVRSEVASGPVLLVDDMVDSRWSLTVCGIELANAGSGSVIPLALAETSGAAP